MLQPAPERIGRYDVVTLLGEGGMARAYLAVFRGPAGFNKLAVIKQIRPELAWDRDFVAMFLDEARLAARLSHPNVVQTYEVLVDEGHYNLAMEYLEGQTLSEIHRRMDRRCIPLEEQLWVLTQVLAGLQYAHALQDYDGTPLKIVHRDVNPANVFVTYNGEVKLLDFGIAKASGAVATTKRGMVKGKLGYCAPEQLQGAIPDGRTDIFAVGVMLWEAIAGRRMTKGSTAAVLAEARMSGKERKIREVCPDVSPALAEICDRALAPNPAERYPTAAEFQRDLEIYLEEHPRRVGRAQIAERLRGQFEHERRETRERIEEQLAAPRRDPSGVRDAVALAAARLDSSGVRDAVAERRESAATVVSRPRLVPVPKPSAPSAPSAPSVSSTVTGRWLHLTRWLFAPAAALVGVVVVGVALWHMSRRPATEVVASGVVAPTPAPAPIPAPVPSDPVRNAPPVARQPPPAPETIQLVVTVEPKEATLRLDGKVIAENPFRAEVPRDRTMHVLRATAPGFAAEEQVISFSSDLRLNFDLNRSHPVVHTAIKRHPPHVPAKVQPASKSMEEPGEPLASPVVRRAPPTQIDERDPYSP